MFQHKKERACVSSQELWRGYCNWTHSPLYFNAQDAPGWGERQADGRQRVSGLRPLVNLYPGPSFLAEPGGRGYREDFQQVWGIWDSEEPFPSH